MKRLGLARSHFGYWTLWIFLGKFRLTLKKNRTWILLELSTPTQAFTIESGFPGFFGFRAHVRTPLW